jgi:hypothetical protein
MKKILNMVDDDLKPEKDNEIMNDKEITHIYSVIKR